MSPVSRSFFELGGHATAVVRRTRFLAAVGLTTLLTSMIVIVVASGEADRTQSPAPATTVAAPPPKPATTPVAAVEVPATGVGAYDPEGDRSENGGQAGLATDGDPGTAWQSEKYRSTFTKSGVGLVLDLSKPLRASRVVLTTTTPGYDAEIQVGNSATGPFTTVSGSKDTTATTTFELKPRLGSHLVVWITSMPTGGAAAVNEVTVYTQG